MLDVCMPLARGRRIGTGVLDFTQIVATTVLVECDLGPDKQGDWVGRVAEMRTRLLTRVVADYWLALDDDAIVGSDTIIDAILTMMEEPRLGALGIRVGDAPLGPDIALTCALVRSRASDGYEFRTERIAIPGANGWDRQGIVKCECMCFCDDLRADGWDVRYSERGGASLSATAKGRT